MSFEVIKWIISPPGLFCASLHGDCRHSDSVANAEKLVERFQQQKLNGILLDYRDTTLCHSEEEYAELAKIFGQGLPRDLPFSYAFNSGQLGHVLFMTRTLTDQGLHARAFRDRDAAESWALHKAYSRQRALGLEDGELQAAV